MNCKNCGTELSEGTPFCTSCGTPTEEEPTVQKTSVAEKDAPAVKKYAGKAIAGFVLALVGIVVAAIPCGILGLVFSALAMKITETAQYKGRGLAISGLVISIIDIVLGFIFLVTL
ncbi:MAG: DUF4190 domain-containing protein [Clostridia bacterium]|nr:DUF4190 domain-containing protein [Clostridia bacterium]